MLRYKITVVNIKGFSEKHITNVGIFKHEADLAVWALAMSGELEKLEKQILKYELGSGSD